jgi:3D (Asp-Asp-Asp) domain-containing protein
MDDPRSHNIIAVSRDLEKLGFVMGAKVCVENAGPMNGLWVIEDRMNKRWTRRIDFLVNTKRKAGKWNKTKIKLIKE